MKQKNNHDRKYQKRKNRVLATGNKWAIQNFNELNRRN